MQLPQLFALLDRPAPTLRQLDTLLTNPRPGIADRQPLIADLDGACCSLAHQVQQVTGALQVFGATASAAW